MAGVRKPNPILHISSRAIDRNLGTVVKAAGLSLPASPACGEWLDYGPRPRQVVPEEVRVLLVWEKGWMLAGGHSSEREGTQSSSEDSRLGGAS